MKRSHDSHDILSVKHAKYVKMSGKIKSNMIHQRPYELTPSLPVDSAFSSASKIPLFIQMTINLIKANGIDIFFCDLCSLCQLPNLNW